MLNVMIHKPKKGFTLVELLISIAILSILAIGTMYVINPLGQIAKAKDGVRLNDLSHIKTALNMYYNDHNNFPATLTFGSKLSDNNTVYASIIPQDSNLDTPYVYQTNSTNSQWAIIYAKLTTSYPAYINCELSSLKSCLPRNYNFSGYNYCVVLGNPDCAYISQSIVQFPNMPTNNKTCKNEGGECVINNSKKSCCPGFTCVPYNSKSGNGICR